MSSSCAANVTVLGPVPFPKCVQATIQRYTQETVYDSAIIVQQNMNYYGEKWPIATQPIGYRASQALVIFVCRFTQYWCLIVYTDLG